MSRSAKYVVNSNRGTSTGEPLATTMGGDGDSKHSEPLLQSVRPLTTDSISRPSYNYNAPPEEQVSKRMLVMVVVICSARNAFL